MIFTSWRLGCRLSFVNFDGVVDLAGWLLGLRHAKPCLGFLLDVNRCRSTCAVADISTGRLFKLTQAAARTLSPGRCGLIVELRKVVAVSSLFTFVYFRQVVAPFSEHRIIEGLLHAWMVHGHACIGVAGLGGPRFRSRPEGSVTLEAGACRLLQPCINVGRHFVAQLLLVGI